MVHCLLRTSTEIIAFIAQGKAYLAIYGIITYDDVFGAHHWTKFCTWPATNGVFHTYECTQFQQRRCQVGQPRWLPRVLLQKCIKIDESSRYSEFRACKCQCMRLWRL